MDRLRRRLLALLSRLGALARGVASFALLAAAAAAAAAAAPVAVVPAWGQPVPLEPTLRILSWHDIRDRLMDDYATRPDPTAVDTRDLVAQFELIRTLGYTPVSLQQWRDALAGGTPLPSKPVLLTFDDGYASVYTHVFPLLRLYRFPAVVAVVGSWMDDPSLAPAGAAIVDWAQLRTMVASGLVEVASHTYDLHRGIPANPQGNLQPAATALRFEDGRYEAAPAQARRLARDFAAASTQFERQLGQAPRAIVWPFGAHNEAARQAAAEAGYAFALSLDPASNRLSGSPLLLGRQLVETPHSLGDLGRLLESAAAPAPAIAPADRVSAASAEAPGAAALAGLGTIRSLRVHLDTIHDPDPERQEAKLSVLLDRVQRLGVNAVLLDAASGSEADGYAGGLYFPNRHLPMRADLLNRVAWQLRTRVAVKVFAVMPLRGLAAGGDPGDPAVRRRILEVFEDLGLHAAVAGLVVRHERGLVGTRAGRRLAREAADVVRRRQPTLIAAAEFVPSREDAAIAPDAVNADLDALARDHDLVFVTAWPQPLETMRTDRWTTDLVATLLKRFGAGSDPQTAAWTLPSPALDRLVFEVEAPAARAAIGPLRLLLDAGVRHVGYAQAQASQASQASQADPDLESLRRLVSTSTQFERRE